MKKRLVFFALATVIALSATACNKKEEVVPILDEATDTYDTGDLGQEEESTEDNLEDIAEPTQEYVDGRITKTDITEERLENALKSAKNGVNQLYYHAGMYDINAEVAAGVVIASRDRFLKSLGITEDELKGIEGQEAINQFLLSKGLNENETYGFSIYSYILDALEKGDDYEATTPEEKSKELTVGGYKNYLTKTKELLAANGLDFDKLLNISDVEGMASYVNSASGLSLYDLNCKLWVHSIFPGVDVDASALMNSSTPDDFLRVFTDAGYSVADLKETTGDIDRANELLKNLEKIEQESIAKEEGKNNGGNSKGGNSNGGGSSNKSDVASNINDKLEEKANKETIPDNGGANSISFIVNGGDNGWNDFTGTGSNKSKSSTNASGHSTITIGDEEYGVKIIVKEIVRRGRAIAYIADSNSNLPGEIKTDDIPDDFEWVVTKFVVKAEDEELDEVSRPNVRVKTSSGSNIENGTATRVFYIEPENSNDSGDEKTYYVAFWLPEDQKVFYLYFGDSSGSVYKFKSSTIENDDDDDDDDDD